ncbi:MAG: hypothetical protein AB7L09_01995 [Nitrospira sp.]
MAKKLPIVGQMWTVSVGNEKTGVIPTQYVGLTRDETWDSCQGCNLRPDAGGGCYAWNGNSSRGANSVRKAVANGRAADLRSAIERAPRSAKAVRFGAIGDPSRVDRAALYADIEHARAAGFKVLAYTHMWRREPHNGRLKREMLASCETMAQAEEALSKGWLVTVAGPDKVEGMVTCPHYARPEIQCNRCTLCDVPTLRRTGFRGVVFPAHGIQRKRLPMAKH